jgi:hypothetical protein
MNKIVAVDVDGVLADFDGAFCRKFGWNKRHIYSLQQRYPTKKFEIELFVMSLYTYERLDILSLGVKIVRFLYENGFSIHIVSSRPENTDRVTGEWLKRHRIPFHYLSVGIPANIKPWHYMNMKPGLVLEDSLDIALSATKLGIYSFLIDQPWNFSVNSYLVKRIKTFETFVEEFNKISHTLM